MVVGVGVSSLSKHARDVKFHLRVVTYRKFRPPISRWSFTNPFQCFQQRLAWIVSVEMGNVGEKQRRTSVYTEYLTEYPIVL